MHNWKTLAAGLVLAVAPALPAHAEFSAEVTLTSDYVWRGVTQTGEKPAFQAGLEYEHETGLYAGLWGSNVDFDEDEPNAAQFEVDYYAGWRGETEEGIGWDLSVLRYTYPDTTLELDYNEFVVALSYGIFTVEFAYSNDVFATGKDGFYYNLGASHEFPELFTLSASVGYSDFDRAVVGDGVPDHYVDWRIGVSREIWGVNFDLSYYDTNGDGNDLYGSNADARVVLSASMTF